MMSLSVCVFLFVLCLCLGCASVSSFPSSSVAFSCCIVNDGNVELTGPHTECSTRHTYQNEPKTLCDLYYTHSAPVPIWKSDGSLDTAKTAVNPAKIDLGGSDLPKLRTEYKQAIEASKSKTPKSETELKKMFQDMHGIKGEGQYMPIDKNPRPVSDPEKIAYKWNEPGEFLAQLNKERNALNKVVLDETQKLSKYEGDKSHNINLLRNSKRLLEEQKSALSIIDNEITAYKSEEVKTGKILSAHLKLVLDKDKVAITPLLQAQLQKIQSGDLTRPSLTAAAAAALLEHESEAFRDSDGLTLSSLKHSQAQLQKSKARLRQLFKQARATTTELDTTHDTASMNQDTTNQLEMDTATENPAHHPWLDGIIVYKWMPRRGSVANETSMRNLFTASVADYEANTCVFFEEFTPAHAAGAAPYNGAHQFLEADALQLTSESRDAGSQTNGIGYHDDPPRTLQISGYPTALADTATTAHELGHAIGLAHTNKRTDAAANHIIYQQATCINKFQHDVLNCPAAIPNDYSRYCAGTYRQVAATVARLNPPMNLYAHIPIRGVANFFRWARDPQEWELDDDEKLLCTKWVCAYIWQYQYQAIPVGAGVIYAPAAVYDHGSIMHYFVGGPNSCLYDQRPLPQPFGVTPGDNRLGTANDHQGIRTLYQCAANRITVNYRAFPGCTIWVKSTWDISVIKRRCAKFWNVNIMNILNLPFAAIPHGGQRAFVLTNNLLASGPHADGAGTNIVIGGAGARDTQFRIYPTPTIINSPPNANENTEIRITGTDFSTDRGRVTIGAGACSVTHWSDVEVRCRTYVAPPAGPGRSNLPVVVINAGGGASAPSATLFAFNAPIAPVKVQDANGQVKQQGKVGQVNIGKSKTLD